jgi:hypothetical protein
MAVKATARSDLPPGNRGTTSGPRVFIGMNVPRGRGTMDQPNPAVPSLTSRPERPGADTTQGINDFYTRG